jgi:hypothetical protein
VTIAKVSIFSGFQKNFLLFFLSQVFQKIYNPSGNNTHVAPRPSQRADYEGVTGGGYVGGVPGCKPGVTGY